MGNSKSSGRKEKPADWIQRFPWCRGLDAYQTIWRPPTDSTYPHWLQDHHLLVEEERFLRFMRHAWAIDLSHADLNTLEYFGLVMPVRKAAIGALQREHRVVPVAGGEEVHRPTSRWEHRIWTFASRRARNPEHESLSYWTIGPSSPLADHRMTHVRPSPVLVVEYESTFMPTPPSDPRGEQSWPRAIPPPEGTEAYTAADLRSRGVWWRPTDPQYWLALAQTSASLAHSHSLPSGLPRWLKSALGSTTLNPVSLAPRHLIWTGYGVTRFYFIGGGRGPANKHRRSMGQVGRGPGQDWWVAQAVGRLRLRTGLDIALEIEGAMQKRGVNANRRLLDRLREDWKRWGRDDEARLPAMVPTFHRDALLRALHLNRPEGVSANESQIALGRLANLAPESAKAAIFAGRRSLAGN